MWGKHEVDLKGRATQTCASEGAKPQAAEGWSNFCERRLRCVYAVGGALDGDQRQGVAGYAGPPGDGDSEAHGDDYA
jgi:hypothetical protein